MTSSPKKLLGRHAQLVHSEGMKVTSHVQRLVGEWYLNTLMVEGCCAPFRYRRQEPYRNLQGQRVNLTYYPASETVGGLSIEVMKVVRIRIT